MSLHHIMPKIDLKQKKNMVQKISAWCELVAYHFTHAPPDKKKREREISEREPQREAYEYFWYACAYADRYIELELELDIYVYVCSDNLLEKEQQAHFMAVLGDGYP